MYITSPPYHGTPTHRAAILPTGHVVYFDALHVTESPGTIQVKGVVYWYCGVLDGYAYYTADRTYSVSMLDSSQLTSTGDPT